LDRVEAGEHFVVSRNGRPVTELRPVTRQTPRGETRLEPVDLSSMTFDHVVWGERRLAIDPPLTLSPTMDDESGQLFVLSDQGLGIHVFAPTRDQLMAELAEQLFFQWDAYACESPDRLTLPARQLPEDLINRMRQDDHNSGSRRFSPTAGDFPR
jgi:antitoxin (DNA-binding transcriptional repressor) of toxin-antitoxin stability system